MTWAEVGAVARGVLLAVAPLAVLFAIFQALFLRLPRREVTRIVAGTAVASAGLFLFLVGVTLGFLPAGRAIGEAVGGLTGKGLLFPFGFLLGFVTTWGEPAVRILADEVEDASAGSIRRSLVVWAMCLGVGVAVGVGLLRIANATPLLAIVVPGYVLALVMLWRSDRDFIGIAVDAGGVATGPLANTFLLALALGASSGMDGADSFEHGFGMVALIALAPVMSVMALGVFVRERERRKES